MDAETWLYSFFISVSHYVTPALDTFGSVALKQCNIACRSKCFMVIANMKTIFYLMNNQKPVHDY